jgi:hypothetical protein
MQGVESIGGIQGSVAVRCLALWPERDAIELGLALSGTTGERKSEKKKGEEMESRLHGGHSRNLDPLRISANAA